ncbi:MAG: polyisoprenoid-binding protein [Proteobacteria bacterium]|nr:polyisoprenoid-binding protein [Pseudomonadota bacterium]
MTRLQTLLLAVLLALPVPLLAEAPTTNTSKAPAGPYVMDKNHASLLFRVNHLGFSFYHGRFNGLDGKIEFDPIHPENSKVDTTIDIASVDTHNAKLEDELRNDQWFNAVKFPTATFHSTKITRTAPDLFTMEGDLTMMGVTHPVTLNVAFHGYGVFPMNNKPTLGFGASTSIKRSLWGFTKAVPMVSDEVLLQIEAEFNYVGAVPPPPAALPGAPATK